MPAATWAVLRLGTPPVSYFHDRELALIQAVVENGRALSDGRPDGYVVRLWSTGQLRGVLS